MKNLIPLVVFAVGALFAAEPPRWLTISTLLGEREEEIAKDIRFLGKETIVDAVAFSCTLVPEGDPVVDKAALLAPRFRKMHELLKGSGVKEGILFQATMGHGWKPNSPAKGQKVILPDGNEKYKFCPLDKTFLDYIAGQASLGQPYFLPDPDSKPGAAVSSFVGTTGAKASGGLDRDAMFDEIARALVIEGKGSTSWIQRNFGLGYNRAGKLMDQMHAAGIVGPENGSKPRAILVDMDTLERILSQK